MSKVRRYEKNNQPNAMQQHDDESCNKTMILKRNNNYKPYT